MMASLSLLEDQRLKEPDPARQMGEVPASLSGEPEVALSRPSERLRRKNCRDVLLVGFSGSVAMCSCKQCAFLSNSVRPPP